jgi:hypothetical protein
VSIKESNMSQKSNQALELIEWREKRNAWPNEIERCEWQGSLESTWIKYIGRNLLEDPIKDINYLKDMDSRFHKRYNFVYLWRFCLMDQVLFKVGVTNSLQSRFKAFRTLIPKTLMSNCEAHSVSTVGKSHSLGKAEDTELNFIVACRQFYLGNEWFDFKGETL